MRSLEMKQMNFAAAVEMEENLEQLQDVQEEWDGLTL